ncbi:MAG: MBL fold metallo-hydrolase [Pseudomonadales bacterium]|nr:MBL fold metallo-hydrolase [Pseudomonadales bacterium]
MSVKIDYVRSLEFEYGISDQVSPLIRRIVAKNPSPFTFQGTGTYILGQGKVAVIDPGPADSTHIEAILAETAGEEITHILVTHTHMDHSPGCKILKESCNAETYAFGPHGSGRQAIGAGVGDSVEEGADSDFLPNHEVVHGQIIEADTWSVECVYTPGHTSNHMCFQLREEKALFTGDHVMGWSTSIISPPDGDMRSYLASLQLLLERDDKIYWPTHGPAIKNPKKHVESFIAHRNERQEQIIKCIKQGIHLIHDMVPVMYVGTPEFMYSAAARSVFAAVVYMLEADILETPDTVSLTANYFMKS